MWKTWLIIAGICFIIEMISISFFAFWFSIGAIIAMLVSLKIESFTIQSTVFVISSVILLFTTKSFTKKVMNSNPDIKTNSYSVEGKEAIVTVNISNFENKGQIKVGGETWSAKSSNNEPIEKGTSVIIEKIEGVKAIVKIK